MNLLGLISAALVVAVGAGAPQPQTEPPSDFAFRFDFKACAGNTLDTYTNRYIRGMGPNQPPISILLALSTAQMAAVYEGVVGIDFFDYPTDFKGGLGVGETITTSPSTSYRFEVRSAGMVHTVTWDDAHTPHSEAANRLLNLFNLIIGFVNDHPDVKRLPAPRIACM